MCKRCYISAVTSAEGKPGPELLGTRLKHALDQFDSGIDAVYVRLGLPGFRPRYNPVIRVLRSAGPSSIRYVAERIGVTHSAASQTVSQLVKEGLVELAPGPDDARQRIASLTPKAVDLLPVLDAEWDATSRAAAELEAELSYPISALVTELLEALARRPMAERVAAAAAANGATSPGPPGTAGSPPPGPRSAPGS